MPSESLEYEALEDGYRFLSEENERLRAEMAQTQTQICGACGQPWTGEGCGQKDNGHPFQTCYPVVSVNPLAEECEHLRLLAAELAEALDGVMYMAKVGSDAQYSGRWARPEDEQKIERAHAALAKARAGEFLS